MFSLVMVSLSASLFAGCNGRDESLPDLVPLTGKVTQGGSPLADATLSFDPTGETRGAGGSARTDASGQFVAYDRTGDEGLPVGTYRVMISKLLMTDGTLFTPTSEMAPMDAPARESIPSKYSGFEETTLRVTVPEGGGSHDFSLE